MSETSQWSGTASRQKWTCDCAINSTSWLEHSPNQVGNSSRWAAKIKRNFKISIGQRDHARTMQVVGQPVRVRIGTHRVVNGTLHRVNPQASRTVPHAALAASNGGPIAGSGQGTSPHRRRTWRDTMRLTEHRFTGVVLLEPQDAAQLRCGERGTASPGLIPASLGVHCWRQCKSGLNRK